MAITSANQLELLQTADAVAREKMIDPELVVEAMEESLARAAKSGTGPRWIFACRLTARRGARRLPVFARSSRKKSLRIIRLSSPSNRPRSIWKPEVGQQFIEEVPPVEMAELPRNRPNR